MIIRNADENDFEAVKEITQKTIREIYPKYYPEGAVKYFSEHHSDENIMRDINAGTVYVLEDEDGNYAGTVTVSGNEIDRLFVLPEYQHLGYGKALLDLAEETIAENYDNVVVDASLPAKKIYLSRGYKEIGYDVIETGYGDYLCYDKMEKRSDQQEYLQYREDIEWTV
jgi:GNAT superfamily N-acetyltransferase